MMKPRMKSGRDHRGGRGWSTVPIRTPGVFRIGTTTQTVATVNSVQIAVRSTVIVPILIRVPFGRPEQAGIE